MTLFKDRGTDNWRDSSELTSKRNDIEAIIGVILLILFGICMLLLCIFD